MGQGSALPESEAELSERIRTALDEDVGAGDWTTLWTVDSGLRSEAAIIAKERLVVAGGGIAARVFHAVASELVVDVRVEDGTRVESGAELLRIQGPTRAILTAERTALNFLGRLSGIATLARRFTDEIQGTGARIIDTRKTTPGWRCLEKWAVRLGGAANHRMGLYDMILVKDNHIAAAGGVREAVLRVRDRNESGLPVEVEIIRPAEARELKGIRVDRILLDNMGETDLRSVVSEIAAWPDPRPQLEASGNMTLARVRAVADTGVSWISVGALTHSARTADVALSIIPVRDASSATAVRDGEGT